MTTPTILFEKKYHNLLFEVRSDGNVKIYLETKSTYLYTIPASLSVDWARDMLNYVPGADDPVDPVAEFTADNVTPYVTDAVQFTDLSTGSPTARERDFWDGSPVSHLQNPVHVFSIAGSYDVSLKVTNMRGESTETKLGFITASDVVAPVAEFSADVVTGDEPLDVQFTDESTNTPTSRVRSMSTNGFKWQIISTDQNPLITFTMPWTYSIRLTATNDGGSDTMQKDAYITITTSDVPPVAAFTFAPDPATWVAPLEVTFTDVSTGWPADERVWDYRATWGGMLDPRINFSYGTDPLVNQNPVFQFPDAGTFDVRFTARNGGGSQSSESIQTGIIVVS